MPIPPSRIPTALQNYFRGWVDHDPEAIALTLAEPCVIIESHGPTYRGSAQVLRWAEEWFQSGNTVDRWDITSVIWEASHSSVEWVFECTVEGTSHSFEGASTVILDGSRIAYLREYRTTVPVFDAQN